MTYSVTTEGAWAVTRQNTDMVHTIKRVTADCVEAHDVGGRLLGEVKCNANGVLGWYRRVARKGDYLSVQFTPYFDVIVFEEGGIVWWADRSAITYCCSAKKLLYVDPLYFSEDIDDILPDAGYWDLTDVLKQELIEVDFRDALAVTDDPGWCGIDEVTENSCADEIREGLCANHVI